MSSIVQGQTFLSISNCNKYFYRIVYNTKTGLTLNISKFEKVQDSFYVDDIVIDSLKNEGKEIDIISGITCLPNDLDTTKTYKINNYKDNKNNISISLKEYDQTLYSFSDKISLMLAGNVFSPNIYGYLTRLILNKFYKESNILNEYEFNPFLLVDNKNEKLYRQKFVNSEKFIRSTTNKTLFQISDACYILPKFYKNILYTNVSFEKISYGHFNLIKSNYDEIWLTSNFEVDFFKENLPSRIKVKCVKPGIRTSIYEKENINENNLNVIKNAIPGIEDKFVFVNISLDTFRSGIDVLLESYFKAFKENPNVFLILLIEPMDIYQTENKTERIKYYQTLIDSIRHKYSIKQIPYIYLQYGNLSQEKRSLLYRLANCFVLTSRAEGFCLPLLEAILSDCDVITHNHTGVAEIFEGSEITDFIPTILRQSGTKEFGYDGRLQYSGDYPELETSPDFTPMCFGTYLHDYDQQSIEWLANKMKSKVTEENNKRNMEYVKNKIKIEYNELDFYDKIESEIIR